MRAWAPVALVTRRTASPSVPASSVAGVSAVTRVLASARFSRAVSSARSRWRRAGLAGVEGGLAGLEQGDDAGEPLGQGVVDLAGQAVPFGLDAGLVVRRGEFGPGRLQLLDERGALQALLDPPGHPAAVHV